MKTEDGKHRFGDVVKNIQKVHTILDQVGLDINSLKKKMKESSSRSSSTSDLRNVGINNNGLQTNGHGISSLESNEPQTTNETSKRAKVSSQSIGNCKSLKKLPQTQSRLNLEKTSSVGRSTELSEFSKKVNPAFTSSIGSRHEHKALAPVPNQKYVQKTNKNVSVSDITQQDCSGPKKPVSSLLPAKYNIPSSTNTMVQSSSVTYKHMEAEKNKVTSTKRKSRNRFLEERKTPKGLNAPLPKPSSSVYTMRSNTKMKQDAKHAEENQVSKSLFSTKNDTYIWEEEPSLNKDLLLSGEATNQLKSEQFTLTSFDPLICSSIKELPITITDESSNKTTLNKSSCSSKYSNSIGSNKKLSFDRMDKTKMSLHGDTFKSRLPRPTFTPYSKSPLRQKSLGSLKAANTNSNALKIHSQSNKKQTVSQVFNNNEKNAVNSHLIVQRQKHFATPNAVASKNSHAPTLKINPKNLLSVSLSRESEIEHSSKEKRQYALSSPKSFFFRQKQEKTKCIPFSECRSLHNDEIKTSSISTTAPRVQKIASKHSLSVREPEEKTVLNSSIAHNSSNPSEDNSFTKSISPSGQSQINGIQEKSNSDLFQMQLLSVDKNDGIMVNSPKLKRVQGIGELKLKCTNAYETKISGESGKSSTSCNFDMSNEVTPKPVEKIISMKDSNDFRPAAANSMSKSESSADLSAVVQHSVLGKKDEQKDPEAKFLCETQDILSPKTQKSQITTPLPVHSQSISKKEIKHSAIKADLRTDEKRVNPNGSLKYSKLPVIKDIRISQIDEESCIIKIPDERTSKSLSMLSLPVEEFRNSVEINSKRLRKRVSCSDFNNLKVKEFSQFSKLSKPFDNSETSKKYVFNHSNRKIKSPRLGSTGNNFDFSLDSPVLKTEISKSTTENTFQNCLSVSPINKYQKKIDSQEENNLNVTGMHEDTCPMIIPEAIASLYGKPLECVKSDLSLTGVHLNPKQLTHIPPRVLKNGKDKSRVYDLHFHEKCLKEINTNENENKFKGIGHIETNNSNDTSRWLVNDTGTVTKTLGHCFDTNDGCLLTRSQSHPSNKSPLHDFFIDSAKQSVQITTKEVQNQGVIPRDNSILPATDPDIIFLSIHDPPPKIEETLTFSANEQKINSRQPKNIKTLIRKFEEKSNYCNLDNLHDFIDTFISQIIESQSKILANELSSKEPNLSIMSLVPHNQKDCRQANMHNTDNIKIKSEIRDDEEISSLNSSFQEKVFSSSPKRCSDDQEALVLSDQEEFYVMCSDVQQQECARSLQTKKKPRVNMTSCFRYYFLLLLTSFFSSNIYDVGIFFVQKTMKAIYWCRVDTDKKSTTQNLKNRHKYKLLRLDDHRSTDSFTSKPCKGIVLLIPNLLKRSVQILFAVFYNLAIPLVIFLLLWLGILHILLDTDLEYDYIFSNELISFSKLPNHKDVY